jgi:hypothetical protein
MRIEIVFECSRDSLVENLDKVMNGFEISEIVIVDIDADAEVKTSVPAINDLEITKLERKNRCHRSHLSIVTDHTSTKLKRKISM